MIFVPELHDKLDEDEDDGDEEDNAGDHESPAEDREASRLLVIVPVPVSCLGVSSFPPHPELLPPGPALSYNSIFINNIIRQLTIAVVALERAV